MPGNPHSHNRTHRIWALLAGSIIAVWLLSGCAQPPKVYRVGLQAFPQSADNRIDAIFLIVEPLAVTSDPFIVMGKFAAEHKIPIGGALMSAGGYDSIFGVNVENIAVGKQAAPLLDKIFKGIPAGTIPVVSAENYIQINYKAAQAPGALPCPRAG